MPWYVETRLLYYRTDIAEKAGITEAPKTWDELKATARAMQEKGGAKFGINLSTNNWQEYLPFVWQAGGDLAKGDEFTLNSPQGAEATGFYKSFADEGLSPNTTKQGFDITPAFVRGSHPMFFSGPWHMGLIDEAGGKGFDKKWAVAPMPTKETNTSFVGGSNWAVFKSTENRDAAWKFVEWMSKPETQAKWYEVSSDLPANQAAWKLPALAEDPNVAIFGKQLENAKSPPPFPKWEEIGTALNAELDKVIGSGRQRPAGRGPARADGGRDRHRMSSIAARRRANIAGWGFVTPFTAIFAVFMLLPILASLALSFTSFSIGNIQDWTSATFVGLDNYTKLFSDEVFVKSLRNTAYFVVGGVPPTIIIGLLLAVALNQGIGRLRAMFRVGFYLPVITSIVAVAVVWRYMLDPDVGILNAALALVGIQGPDWLGQPNTTMPSIIALGVWRNIGNSMVLFLAALQTVDPQLYEAARVDGAKGRQLFRHVTLPMLRPAILFVTVITTIGYLQVFEEPFVMTGPTGGPDQAGLTTSLFVYQQGFRFFNLGYASAAAYTLFIFIVVLAIVQFRFLREKT